MSDYILSALHIEKSYGHKQILTDLSLDIYSGEIYGLIGKNGSGKTTLLRILTGLTADYNGSININCKSDKCTLAASIDSPSLFMNLTAFENLKIQSFLLDKTKDSEIYEMLDLVGLVKNRTKVCNFSLGMLQKLKIASVLLLSPQILILDEPVNGLDPESIAGLRSLLKKINKGMKITIIISSHILSELENTASRFGILDSGMISHEITAAELRHSSITLEDFYLDNISNGRQHDDKNDRK